MASRQQQLEAVAFAYSKSGGWWGQLYQNVRLILSLSLYYQARKEGLNPYWADLVFTVRWPRQVAGRWIVFTHGHN